MTPKTEIAALVAKLNKSAFGMGVRNPDSYMAGMSVADALEAAALITALAEERDRMREALEAARSPTPPPTSGAIDDDTLERGCRAALLHLTDEPNEFVDANYPRMRDLVRAILTAALTHTSKEPAAVAPPEPPWPPGVGDNAKRVGWVAYHEGKGREDVPFPANRADLWRAYREGWDAALHAQENDQ